MGENVYEQYIEGNPEEYENLKQRIREWLKDNSGKSYPRTTEIAEEVVDTDKLKGGFYARLAAVAIDDLGLEQWNPDAQHSRIKNPFAFDGSV
jgi:hypothetical protein